jgi:hypothetical protein
MNFDLFNRYVTLLANVGVLIGLFVLIIELRQNTEIMRAQIHNDAMTIRVSNRMAEANSGEIARIFAKINEASEERTLGLNEETLEILTEEERVRLRARMIGARDDFGNLYYQCQQGFLDQEFCQYRFRAQVIALLPQWRVLGVIFSGQRPSFIAAIQRIAKEEGLPAPDDDGAWN